jgi:hypothetical protein
MIRKELETMERLNVEGTEENFWFNLGSRDKMGIIGSK